MKPKKLEKRVQFIFKKTNMVNLTNEQMKGINGGRNLISDPNDPSAGPGCPDKTIANQTVTD